MIEYTRNIIVYVTYGIDEYYSRMKTRVEEWWIHTCRRSLLIDIQRI